MSLEVRRVLHEAADSNILSVAINPFRRELYTGLADSRIKVWHSETGEFLRTLHEHSGWVTGLIYSTLNRLLFSSSVDGKIKVWNNKCEVTWTEKINEPIYCLALEHKKNYLIAGFNKEMRVYSIEEEGNLVVKSTQEKIPLKLLHTLKSHKDLIRSIVCSDHGKIYSGGYDGTVCIYDSENPRKYTTIMRAHDGAISCVAFDNVNNWLITGSFDGSAKIWSQDGKALQKFEGFSEAITGVCYVPATRQLLIAASSPEPAVYDPRTGMNVTEFVPSLAPPECGDAAYLAFFPFPDTQEVVGTTSGRHLVLWKFNGCGAKRIVRGGEEWVESLCVAYGSSVYSASADGSVRRWEASSQVTTDLYSCQEVIKTQHAGSVLCMAFREYREEEGRAAVERDGTFVTNSEDLGSPGTPSGLPVKRSGTLVTASDDCTIRVWTTASGSLQMDMSDTPKFIFRTQARPAGPTPGGGRGPAGAAAGSGEATEGHSDRIVGLVVVEDIVVSVSWDMSIRYWDLVTGTAAHVIAKAHTDLITGVDYSPDGDEIGTSSADKLAKVWDFDSGQALLVLTGHTADVTCIKWNPVHHVWVTGSEDETVRTWHAKSGAMLQLMKSRGGGVNALGIDLRRGYVLAASSQDFNIRLYDPVAGEALQIHTGHADAVRAIVHVPERRQYLSCSWDRTIRVWNDTDHPEVPAGRGAGETSSLKSPAASAATLTTIASTVSVAEPDSDPAFTPYHILHPPLKPKSLAKQAIGFDKIIRKTFEAAEPAPRRDEEEEEAERKRRTRVGIRLGELEDQLRALDAPHASAPRDTAASAAAVASAPPSGAGHKASRMKSKTETAGGKSAREARFG
eukprot:tig00021122_g18442.t1